MLHISSTNLTRLFTNSRDKVSASFSFLRKFNRTIMKGVLVSEFGPADVCKYKTDLPVPEPGDDQVSLDLICAILFAGFGECNLIRGFFVGKKTNGKFYSCEIGSNQDSCCWYQPSGNVYSSRHLCSKAQVALHARQGWRWYCYQSRSER